MTETAESNIVQEIYNNIRLSENTVQNTGEPRDHTYFAPGTVFEGTLHSDGDVEIEGQFSGEIVSDGKVTLYSDTSSSVSARSLSLIGSTLSGDSVVTEDVQVDDTSYIKGNIRALGVDCAGTIIGNIRAGNLVSLQSTASVSGDIKTAALVVTNGAQVHGKIDMS